jgi:hypothetical protein
MLAAVRRGPGSVPTEDEKIEYLMQRKRHDQVRPQVHNFSLEHVSGRSKTQMRRARCAIATALSTRLSVDRFCPTSGVYTL